MKKPLEMEMDRERAIVSRKTPVLACKGLKKVYGESGRALEVLSDITLEVAAGERIAVTGSSGSGKTTLLNLLGGLDTPTAGTVTVDGQSLVELSEAGRGRLRNRALGFVYQFHHLLGEFSALENVAMPLLIGGAAIAEAAQRAERMLERVGLGGRLDHKPAQLSGGERQRVAIARALVTSPTCVLMDEPTGNLDRQTAANIQALIRELNETLEISFVIVTHDEILAASMDRTLRLRDGRLVTAPESS